MNWPDLEPCCMDRRCGRSYPSLSGIQAMRTEIERPSPYVDIG